MSCDKCKKHKQKTALNNQWAGTATNGNLTDFNDQKDKTEFSNEWFSTNKMVDEQDVEKETNQNR